MVRTIIGGPSMGDTNRAQKGYTRQAVALYQVNNVNHQDKIPWLSEVPITFKEEEAQGLIHPHKDAIVVSLKITGRKVHRVLIDNGSSMDILFSSTLDRMNLIGHTFTPIWMPLYSVSGESVYTKGELDRKILGGKLPIHLQRDHWPTNAQHHPYCHFYLPSSG